MPPLIGSDEDVSDGEAIPFRNPKGAEEEDEEEEEDEYVIEKIEGHNYDVESGDILYKVKWEGYDGEEDRTWEPEENLASAKESLEAYYKKIGGKPEKPSNAKSATKKRKANSTPGGARGGKRGKSETPEVSSQRKKAGKGGNTVVKDEFKLPKGSWDDLVADIDTIEEALDDKGLMQRFVYVMWENGHKTRHQLKTVNEKCPQKMLRYYESHLVFRGANATETNGGASA